MPRNVVFVCANSLDNYIARLDGSVDWLLWSDEIAKILENEWKRFDTLIMGRKTYDVMQKLSADDPGMNPVMTTYVFSRNKKARVAKDAELVTSDAIAFVRKLKTKRGKDIGCMGGGEFLKHLLDAGLIDQVSVNIHPVLLGKGIPLFLPLQREVGLELMKCHPLPHGCVALDYRVKPAAARQKRKTKAAVSNKKKPARKTRNAA